MNQRLGMIVLLGGNQKIGRFWSCSVSALAIAGAFAAPAFSQNAAPAAASDKEAQVQEIVVTAQRTSQSLQDVPIAVSALSGNQLEKQQINNVLQLQFSLPNVTFTKGNFTSSNITIRGIGSGAVGASSDNSVGIHQNEIPLVETRLFEQEYFDLERLEVLRGPQGTLFGRNATGGVLDYITAKPKKDWGASGEIEFGNFSSVKVNGAINVPLTDNLQARVAGNYTSRDGYTTNLTNNTRIDGRDLYSVRGSLRFRPTENDTIDFVASYFKEDDNRERIQKQLCDTDPTGVLGCLPTSRAFGYLNSNSTLNNIISSREFLSIAFAPSFIPATAARVAGQLIAAGVPAATAQAQGFATARQLFNGLSLGSIYDNNYNSSNGLTNPTDVRTVATGFSPNYRADETIFQGNIKHEFEKLTLTVLGGYQSQGVRSQEDYNSLRGNVIGSLATNTLALVSPASARVIFPGGNPANGINVSAADPNGVGNIGGNTAFASTRNSQFDQSSDNSNQWSIEGHVTSKFDGRFNFLLGGLYISYNEHDVDYFVNASGLDYGSTVLGLGNPGGPGGLASPFFLNAVPTYGLRSWAVFGETYVKITDDIKFTGGLRYTEDKKYINELVTFLNVPTAFGTQALTPVINALEAANGGLGARTATGACVYDADPLDVTSTGAPAACQGRFIRSTTFPSLTGRAVLEWKPTLSFTDETNVYVSYTRGYKAGGFNPAIDPALGTVPLTYSPEHINAIEIGTKNRLLGGRLQANFTAFYYDYSNLQISRIFARTSVNDNTNATIWGLEGEFKYRVTKQFELDLNASYQNSRINNLSLINARDPSGGRSDAVIIKDITNSSNCAVVPNVAGSPNAVALVNTFNAGLNAQLAPLTGNATTLRPAVPVPGTGAGGANPAFGAFSICNSLRTATVAGGAPSATNPLLTQAFNVRVVDGVAVNLDGNELQNTPPFKFSVAGQYDFNIFNDWKGLGRVDYAYTGRTYGRNFNTPIDRISPYGIVNLTLALTNPNGKFTIRGFVQNLADSQGTTGEYVTSDSSGLFTNIFTVEPRRYGVAMGVKF